jgi:hypothetical protein
MATRALKFLLHLYPSSWRKRYGHEMSDLMEELPSGPGVAMDLLIGAGAAYVIAIRENRVLSSAASYLHGICVAVLVQAIGFITVILVSQRSHGPFTLALGPFPFVSVSPALYLGIRNLTSEAALVPVLGSLSAVAVLVLLLAALAVLVAGPGWVRRRLA